MKTLHLVGPPPYCTNCFILISDQNRAIVIDPAPAADQIDQVLKDRGAELALILLTHGHFDHVTSVNELKRRWNCPVYLDKRDVRGDEIYPLSLETEQYTDGGKVELDDISITCWNVPGHSEGSWLLQCGALVFCGDTIFQGSVGRTDLEGGSRADQRQSLARIRTLPIDPDSHLLPGHGPFTTLAEELENNPYFMF